MKFTPRSALTRQFIIEKTASIFNKQGYAGTSITSITEATHLTKGSIYGNFKNKEELALAVFAYNLACVQTAVQAQVDLATSYKEKLRAHVNVHSNESNFLAQWGNPLQNTAIEADDTNEGLRRAAADGLLAWKQDLVTIIQNGMKTGEFNAETVPHKVALTIIALIEGAYLLGGVTHNPLYSSVLFESANVVIEDICRS